MHEKFLICKDVMQFNEAISNEDHFVYLIVYKRDLTTIAFAYYTCKRFKLLFLI